MPFHEGNELTLIAFRQIESSLARQADKDLLVEKKIDELLEKEDYLAELVQKQVSELERISGISSDEAKRILMENLKQDLQQEFQQAIKENEAKIRETSDEKAKEILKQNQINNLAKGQQK